MRRILYSTPRSIKTEYNPILKYIIVDKFNPTLKGVLVDVVYTMVFSYHVPTLLKHGRLIGETEFFKTDSVKDFFSCYVGKILFFFLIFYVLNFVYLPIIKKQI